MQASSLLGRVCKLGLDTGKAGLFPVRHTTRLAEDPANGLRSWTRAGPLHRSSSLHTRSCNKNRDTVGELVGYAASAAKREMRVGASGRPANQAATRSRLRAAAVATCCRRVLARPR